MATFPTLGKSKGVKDNVISILSHEWPLSAKKIYNIVRKDKNVSYQAVHKALRELLEDGVLVREDRKYKLGLKWVEENFKRIAKIRQKFLKEKYLVNSGQKKEIKTHRNMVLYLDRESTTRTLIEITHRANRGDVLFGQCRTCTDYPRDFYESLTKAVNRGVIINFMIPKSLDTVPFVEFLYRLSQSNPEQVKVKTCEKEYVRLFGIAGKEIMLALPFTDSFISVHFYDRRVTNYILNVFKKHWEESNMYGLGAEL